MMERPSAVLLSVAAARACDVFRFPTPSLSVVHVKNIRTYPRISCGEFTIIGPIPWGHSGPLCHSLSLSSSSWTSMRRRRATVATPGELQCKTARSGEWAQHFSNASCFNRTGCVYVCVRRSVNHCNVGRPGFHYS